MTTGLGCFCLCYLRTDGIAAADVCTDLDAARDLGKVAVVIVQDILTVTRAGAEIQAKACVVIRHISQNIPTRRGLSRTERRTVTDL